MDKFEQDLTDVISKAANLMVKAGVPREQAIMIASDEATDITKIFFDMWEKEKQKILTDATLDRALGKRQGKAKVKGIIPIYKA